MLAISGIVLAGGGVFVANASAATPADAVSADLTATPLSATLTATADSYVSAKTTTANYGNADPLLLSRYAYHGLVRFNTSSLPVGSVVTSATLKVFSDQTLNGSVVVSPESDGWTENGVNADNQPTWNSNVVATSTPLQASTYASATLPASSIPTGGNVDFGLSTTQGLLATVGSRESAHAPELLVSYLPVATSRASTTGTPTTSPGGGVFTQTALAAAVSGTAVTFSGTVAASSPVAVTNFKICARSASNQNLDWGAENVTLTPAGTSYNGVARTFAPGVYTYFTCFVNPYTGSWWNGPSKTVDITGTTSSSTTTTTPTTPVSTTSSVVTTTPTKNPSGQPMPQGDLPGWHQIFADDFTVPVALGTFPGADTKWDKGYVDGTPDTAGKNNGGRSGYYPDKVLSVGNGMLDMYLHSAGGISMGAAPAPVTKSDWTHNGQLYGRYTARFRADSMKGFKTAWLLWPDSSQWNDGEVDFPEGDLSSSITAFSHCVGNPSANCLAVNTGVSFSAWHTATTEWTPGKVAFYLDGKLIGSTTANVPRTSMHYMLQTESCLTGCPAAGTAGHLQIDWVSTYSYKP